MIERLFNKLTGYVAIRFFISGGTSAFVDLVLLYLLNSVFGVHYLVSAILAFIGAFGVSFTLHKFWTFKSHGESTQKQVVMYLGSSLFGLLLNTLLMYIFVSYVFADLKAISHEINVLLSQVVVGLIVAVVSFFISHRFVFKYKNQNNIEIDIT